MTSYKAKSHEELIKRAGKNNKVYPKGTKLSYPGEVGEVPAHELGPLVDGLHPSMTSLLQSLPEVCLGMVVKDKPSPTFWVCEIRPDHQDFPHDPVAPPSAPCASSSTGPFP